MIGSTGSKNLAEGIASLTSVKKFVLKIQLGNDIG